VTSKLTVASSLILERGTTTTCEYFGGQHLRVMESVRAEIKRRSRETVSGLTEFVTGPSSRRENKRRNQLRDVGQSLKIGMSKRKPNASTTTPFSQLAVTARVPTRPQIAEGSTSAFGDDQSIKVRRTHSNLNRTTEKKGEKKPKSRIFRSDPSYKKT